MNLTPLALSLLRRLLRHLGVELQLLLSFLGFTSPFVCLRESIMRDLRQNFRARVQPSCAETLPLRRRTPRGGNCSARPSGIPCPSPALPSFGESYLNRVHRDSWLR